MLKLKGLNAWYDRSHVVQDLSFEVHAGEIVTLMGRNGAGKTTTLRSLMGLVSKRGGSMQFEGVEMLAQPAHVRFHAGLAYVPEERRIVAGLSVRENLQLGITASRNRHEMARMIEEIALGPRSLSFRELLCGACLCITTDFLRTRCMPAHVAMQPALQEHDKDCSRSGKGQGEPEGRQRPR